MNCELHNDDEDHFHDAGGCIGNGIRRQRDHSNDDDHDRRRTIHATITANEQRHMTKTHIRGMNMIACNTRSVVGTMPTS